MLTGRGSVRTHGPPENREARGADEDRDQRRDEGQTASRLHRLEMVATSLIFYGLRGPTIVRKSPNRKGTGDRDSLERVTAQVVDCRCCPRLVRYRQEVARSKRAAFRDWEYWGRPVPGFGDPGARLLVVGLARRPTEGIGPAASSREIGAASGCLAPFTGTDSRIRPRRSRSLPASGCAIASSPPRCDALPLGTGPRRRSSATANRISSARCGSSRPCA